MTHIFSRTKNSQNEHRGIFMCRYLKEKSHPPFVLCVLYFLSLQLVFLLGSYISDMRRRSQLQVIKNNWSFVSEICGLTDVVQTVSKFECAPVETSSWKTDRQEEPILLRIKITTGIVFESESTKAQQVCVHRH